MIKKLDIVKAGISIETNRIIKEAKVNPIL